MEASGSTPSCSPSQSPARKQMPDCPESRYCLEIQVTSTEDVGTTPPPPHLWQVPLVEDILWDGTSDITQVVVTGPGWATLFYGWWCLEEGVTLGKVCDATLTLSGAISWVGKQSLLSANAVSLWEGQQLIAKAIIKWCIEDRGPRNPCSWLPVLPPFSFCNQDKPPWEEGLQSADEHWEVPRHTHWVSHHEWGCTSQWGWDCGRETLGLPQLWQLHLHWTVGLRVMDVWCQLPPQFHQGPIDLGTPGISTMADAMGSLGAIWKSICPSSRMKTRRLPHLSKLVLGHNDYHQARCQDCTLLPMLFAPCRATWESWWGAQAPTPLWRAWSLCRMSTTTMSRPWTPWTKSFSNYKWPPNKCCWIGGAPC